MGHSQPARAGRAAQGIAQRTSRTARPAPAETGAWRRFAHADPVEAPLVFEEAVELEHPIVLLEPLAFLLNRLLEQLCARLGSRALATQELRLTLELSNLTGIDDDPKTQASPAKVMETRIMNAAKKNMWGQPPSSCPAEQRSASLPPTKIHPHTDPASSHARRQSFSETPATRSQRASPRSPHHENSSRRRTRAAAFGPRRTVSPAIARTGKTGTHPRPHRRHCWRTKSRSAGVARHAPSRRISHAPLCREVARKTPQKKIPESTEEQSRRHSPAPLPPAAARERDAGKWPARALGLSEKKKCRAKCSGKPAPGALPATGGSAKPGRATNGTSLCATEKRSLSTASCTTCSAAAGSWKERMTETNGFHRDSVLSNQLRQIFDL